MGDYKKALEYSKLEKNTQGQIERQRDEPALLEADKNFYLGLKDNQAMKFRAKMYLLMVTGVLCICNHVVFYPDGSPNS